MGQSGADPKIVKQRLLVLARLCQAVGVTANADGTWTVASENLGDRIYEAARDAGLMMSRPDAGSFIHKCGDWLKIEQGGKGRPHRMTIMIDPVARLQELEGQATARQPEAAEAQAVATDAQVKAPAPTKKAARYLFADGSYGVNSERYHANPKPKLAGKWPNCDAEATIRAMIDAGYVEWRSRTPLGGSQSRPWLYFLVDLDDLKNGEEDAAATATMAPAQSVIEATATPLVPPATPSSAEPCQRIGAYMTPLEGSIWKRLVDCTPAQQGGRWNRSAAPDISPVRLFPDNSKLVEDRVLEFFGRLVAAKLIVPSELDGHFRISHNPADVEVTPINARRIIRLTSQRQEEVDAVRQQMQRLSTGRTGSKPVTVRQLSAVIASQTIGINSSRLGGLFFDCDAAMNGNGAYGVLMRLNDEPSVLLWVPESLAGCDFLPGAGGRSEWIHPGHSKSEDYVQQVRQNYISLISLVTTIIAATIKQPVIEAATVTAAEPPPEPETSSVPTEALERRLAELNEAVTQLTSAADVAIKEAEALEQQAAQLRQQAAERLQRRDEAAAERGLLLQQQAELKQLADEEAGLLKEQKRLEAKANELTIRRKTLISTLRRN